MLTAVKGVAKDLIKGYLKRHGLAIRPRKKLQENKYCHNRRFWRIER